jgi:hypothetical protein
MIKGIPTTNKQNFIKLSIFRRRPISPPVKVISPK